MSHKSHLIKCCQTMLYIFKSFTNFFRNKNKIPPRQYINCPFLPLFRDKEQRSPFFLLTCGGLSSKAATLNGAVDAIPVNSKPMAVCQGRNGSSGCSKYPRISYNFWGNLYRLYFYRFNWLCSSNTGTVLVINVVNLYLDLDPSFWWSKI